ncbi:hypothetical protein GWK47_049027 [Chionoecetes opilio]|uniref:Uncharacterized protein n=1 Tax=Chionoecetes opilio TaxID=41210 RepID=A0A8J5CRW7_CHIOP|nr:hypothetical protein GWK47_049027 [Chionoecetes opilio]
MPGLPGTPPLRAHAQRVLAGRHLHQRWRKEPDIQPIPKHREPTKLRPISLISCTLKTDERMVLSRLQWRYGALHLTVLGYTPRVGTADRPPHPADSVSNKCPTITVFLDLERKAFDWPVLTLLFAHLERKGTGEDCSPGSRYYLQSPSGQTSSSRGLQIHATCDLENGIRPGRHSLKPVPVQPCYGGVVALRTFKAGTVPASVRRRPALDGHGRVTGSCIDANARSRNHHRQVARSWASNLGAEVPGHDYQEQPTQSV